MQVRMAAVALLLWAWIAVAQVRETVEVSVTNVDVVVTDGRGRPVRGLAREEFEILEGSRRREITNFSEVNVIAIGEIWVRALKFRIQTSKL